MFPRRTSDPVRCRAHGDPEGSEVLLAIEVADSSVESDREKAAIYAKAGVATYWIINLRSMQVETYDKVNPEAGEYDTVQIHHTGEIVILRSPDGPLLELTVREMLPSS